MSRAGWIAIGLLFLLWACDHPPQWLTEAEKYGGPRTTGSW